MRILRYRRNGCDRAGVVIGDRFHSLPDEHWTSKHVARAPQEGPGCAEIPEPLLAPVRPATVFGMAHNTGPADRARPPQAFLKAAASVSAPGEAIPLPEDIGRVDAEAELAAVVGAPLWRVRPEEVDVVGFTIALDITARQAQQDDPLWTEAKSRRGFTPLGPWIDTCLDPTDAKIALEHNGEVLAEGSSADLARGAAESLAYLSTLVELRPGDVVLTGAPGTFAPVVPGDVVTARISGLGTLSCPVTTIHDREGTDD